MLKFFVQPTVRQFLIRYLSKSELALKWYGAFVAMFFFAASCWSIKAADNSLNSFEQANQDYSAGHYAEAAKGFEAVLSKDGYSAPVLFNIGNAWLKAGKTGRAILSYERALVLDPRNGAIKENLDLALKKANVKTPEIGTLEKFTHWLGWNGLAWSCAAGVLVICLSILVPRIWLGQVQTGSRFVAFGGLALILYAGSSLIIRWPEKDRAVVIVAETPARIAPAEAAGVSFNLSAGALVQTGKGHNGFVLVRTSTGQSGWVNQTNVGKIMAPAKARELANGKPTAAEKTS